MTVDQLKYLVINPTSWYSKFCQELGSYSLLLALVSSSDHQISTIVVRVRIIESKTDSTLPVPRVQYLPSGYLHSRALIDIPLGPYDLISKPAM